MNKEKKIKEDTHKSEEKQKVKQKKNRTKTRLIGSCISIVIYIFVFQNSPFGFYNSIVRTIYSTAKKKKIL